MIPQLGPISSGLAQQPGPDAAATRNTVQGERGAAAQPTSADTARAVEPPRPTEASDASAEPGRRSLNPPDPDAPAGPPPAFEASILDRAREQLMAPPDLRTQAPEPAPVAVSAPVEAPPPPEPVGEAERQIAHLGTTEEAAEADPALAVPGQDAAEPRIPERPEPREPEASQPAKDPAPRSAYDVPPSAEQRAEREVATIRRIETPYDTATVDVSR